MEKENKFGLKSAIKMPPKKEIRTEPVEVEKTEKAVQAIHSGKGKVVRLSLDVDEELYKQLKIHQIRRGFKTTREYLLHLINDDIKNPEA